MRSLPSVLLCALASCGLAPNPAIQAHVDDVRAKELERHIEALCALGPRPGGYRDITDQTLDYLESELRKFGFAPEREAFAAYVRDWQKVEGEDGKSYFQMTMKSDVQHNLIAERRGTSQPECVVELGAHYDTVPFGPGADDNTSGVAALLEAARLLGAQPTQKTVRLVFFAMEEEGLVGSREHVRKLLREESAIEGSLTLDMIGYTDDTPGSQKLPLRIPLLFSPPDVGTYLVVAGNWSSGWLGQLFEDCIDTYVPELPYYSINRLAGWFDDSTRGDHYSYWRNGLESIAIIDGGDLRNPHYHRPTDTPDTLDPVFLRRSTQAVVATMFEWARLAEE